MFCIKCGVENADTSKFCRTCGTPLRQPKEAIELAAQPQPTLSVPKAAPETNVVSHKARVAGVFCYMLLWVSGIFILLFNRKNDFVRFHAWQSTMAFMPLVIIFALVPGGLRIVIWLLIVVLWLFLMAVAFQGKVTRLPGIGNLAWKFSQK